MIDREYIKAENEAQANEIDYAMFIINCWQDDTMFCTKEELSEALQIAKSCMELSRRQIIKEDKSLKELYYRLVYQSRK